jgi:hypothetical protein
LLRAGNHCSGEKPGFWLSSYVIEKTITITTGDHDHDRLALVVTFKEIFMEKYVVMRIKWLIGVVMMAVTALWLVIGNLSVETITANSNNLISNGGFGSVN